MARGMGGAEGWMEVGKGGGAGEDGDIYNSINYKKYKKQNTK